MIVVLTTKTTGWFSENALLMNKHEAQGCVIFEVRGETEDATATAMHGRSQGGPSTSEQLLVGAAFVPHDAPLLFLCVFIWMEK